MVALCDRGGGEETPGGEYCLSSPAEGTGCLFRGTREAQAHAVPLPLCCFSPCAHAHAHVYVCVQVWGRGEAKGQPLVLILGVSYFVF